MTISGKYAGMTLDQRLEEARIMDEWKASVNSKNRFRLMDLLAKVELADQAAWISEAALYGPRW
jgi:hypothetical protein